MVALSRWTAAAVGALTAVAVAGAPATAAGLRFPAPPPGLGTFDKLAAFQCALPAAAARRPCRRVVALRDGRPTAACQPRPVNVCRPPTVGQVYLEGVGPAGAAVDLRAALPYDRHAWKARLDELRRGPLQPGPLLLSKRVAHPPGQRHAKARWLADAFRFEGDALLHERAVASRLTVLRNTFSGSVQRVTGKYDVLSITRLSAGMCLTATCNDMAAVDVAGSSLDDFADGRLPILTAPVGEAADGPRPRAPVAMQSKDLLSLGRAILADPAWLGGPTGPWRVRARVSMFTACHADGAVKNDKVPRQFRNKDGRWKVDWQLGAAATRPSAALWLQAVASVACRGPTWLIRHRALCATAGDARDYDAMRRWRPAQAAVLRNCGATWFFRPPPAAPNGTAGGPPDGGCGEPLRDTGRPYRPAWVAGLGGREINPRGAAEAALAARFGSCRVSAPDGAPFWADRLARGGWAESYIAMQGPREQLSHAFDASTFNVDPPADHAEPIDMILSLIVVLPEAAALVVQSCLPAGRYSLVAMLVTFLVGVASLSGVGMLAVLEVAGSRFRASADLDWLQAHITPAVAGALSAGRNLTGSPLVRSETLLLISAVGYRPRLLLGLAIGSAVAYAALSAAAFITAITRRRRARAAKEVRQQQGQYGGGSAASTWTEEAHCLVGDDRPPPKNLVAKWGLMGGRGWRCLWPQRFTTRAGARAGSPLDGVTPGCEPPMMATAQHER